MKSDIIQNPQEGQVYLVRARIGGAVQSRHKPARIESVYEQDGVKRIRVQFLYEGDTEVTDLVFYDGLVKELSRRWIESEMNSMNDRMVAAHKALWKLEELLMPWKKS